MPQIKKTDTYTNTHTLSLSLSLSLSLYLSLSISLTGGVIRLAEAHTPFQSAVYRFQVGVKQIPHDERLGKPSV